MRLEHVSYA